MTIDQKVEALRAQRIADGGQAVPSHLQGVDKARIRLVLRRLARESDDMVDVVFALLDDITPNFYSKASTRFRFKDGASTAHIACHVGILQRGGTRLDREGRDYWVKPLRELGVIEKVYMHPKEGSFISGWPVAKSPNNCVILSPAFVRVLSADESEWDQLLQEWVSEEKIRERSQVQAAAEQAAKQRVVTHHADLISHCIAYYVPHFLPAFEVVYTDVEDGERVTEGERAQMAGAGIELGLGDAMPDVLLVNRALGILWVIEAVTSDGEVDPSKVQNLLELAARSGYSKIGFTTAYWTWKDAAVRQSSFLNLAPKSYVWIAEDASKHFRAEAFDLEPQPFHVREES